MPGMTVSEVEALVRHVERQGVTAIRKKDGYFFRLPNQDTCNVHFSSSDVNQKHQIRRALKRAGITMPDEPKLSGENRGSTRRSRKIVRNALVRMGDPEVVRIKELRDFLAEPLGAMTITGALVTMGYAPSGSTSARRYHRPQAILGFEEAPVAPAQPQIVPEPTPEQPVEPHREFVDLVGSWMIEPSELPETLTIRDARALLEKVGLGMEIRVWRLDAAQPIVGAGNGEHIPVRSE